MAGESIVKGRHELDLMNGRDLELIRCFILYEKKKHLSRVKRDPPFSLLSGNFYFIADILMLENRNDRILKNKFVKWVKESKR